MKKLAITLFISIGFVHFLQAQFTLEHKYPSAQNGLDMRYIRFGLAGEKYVLMEFSSGTISKVTLYNTNHSVYKQINVPQITDLYVMNLFNFSDNLFNTNASIEYTAYYNYAGGTNTYSPYKMVVYDENGQTLLSHDSVYYNYPANIYGVSVDNNLSVTKSETGSKFMVFANKTGDQSISVYSIPGTPITAGLTEKNVTDSQKAFLGAPAPNPSSDMTRIEFQLPSDSEFGEITVYNTEGLRMKSYKVDKTFNDLILNNRDMPSGSYVYQLYANGRRIGADKMMVIR